MNRRPDSPMRLRFIRAIPRRIVAGLLLPVASGCPLAAQRAQPARDPMQEGLPLKPTRTLSFTTKTGHWMSVDVSPDGRTLVFDLLGDLYTLPITGGTATRLTSGPAFDRDPVFAPDGKRIAFVS